MEEAVPAEAGHRATGPERCFAELALDSVLDDLQVRLEAGSTLRKCNSGPPGAATALRMPDRANARGARS